MSNFVACPKLELLYFDFGGKAEAARLLCFTQGIPLKDTRLSRDEFIALKASGKLHFGQVPALLVDNDTQLAQSSAIMRYLGKLTGLYPSDKIVAARVDMLLDQEVDLFTALSCATYTERFGFGSLSDEQVRTVREAIASDVLPRHLGFLEKMLSTATGPDGEGAGSGWLANTPDATIADYVYAPRLKWLQSGLDNIPINILDPFPHVKEYLDQFYALPKIVEYYS